MLGILCIYIGMWGAGILCLIFLRMYDEYPRARLLMVFLLLLLLTWHKLEYDGKKDP